MNCEELRDWIPLYGGGELQPNERIAVESHIGSCASCAREVGDYRELRACLAPLRDGEGAPDLWEGIQQELFPNRTHPFERVWGLARYAAVWVAGVGIGFAFYTVARQAVLLKSSVSLESVRASDPVRQDPGQPKGRVVPAGEGPGEPYEVRPTWPPGFRPRGFVEGHHLPRVERLIGANEEVRF